MRGFTCDSTRPGQQMALNACPQACRGNSPLLICTIAMETYNFASFKIVIKLYNFESKSKKHKHRNKETTRELQQIIHFFPVSRDG